MADIFHKGKELVNVLENHRHLYSCHDKALTLLPSHTLLLIFFFEERRHPYFYGGLKTQEKFLCNDKVVTAKTALNC